jgi:hypothetical protein
VVASPAGGDPGVAGGVWAHADETARKMKPINAVSLLMDMSPFEEAQRSHSTVLPS